MCVSRQHGGQGSDMPLSKEWGPERERERERKRVCVCERERHTHTQTDIHKK